MLIPLISESAIKAVFTFEVIAVSSTFCPTFVSDEEPEDAESPGLVPEAPPGLPAAPGDADPLSAELAVLEGLGEELDGLEDEDVLDGLEGEPGDDGLESAAVLAGLSALLCEGLVLSCPVSQPANANAIMAEAIALLFQVFMIVFLYKKFAARANHFAPVATAANIMPAGFKREIALSQVALCHVSGIADRKFR
ncbi:MAG: hypothetical protein ACREV0_13700 [Burkholderiales bacterium]